MKDRKLTQSWYHIIVIGTDLAGVIFAALAARLGYRVLVLGQDSMPNAYKRDGEWYLSRPEFLYGFGTSPAVKKAFNRLSLGLEMMNHPEPLSPAFQVAMQGMRLDLGGPRRLWERDLERELGGALPFFDAFDRAMKDLTLRSDPLFGGGATDDATLSLLGGRRADLNLPIFPARNPRERQAIRKLIDGIAPHVLEPETDLLVEAFHPKVRSLIEGVVSHLSLMGSNLTPPLALARLWTHARAGLYRFSGGIDALKAMFLQKVRDQSSDVRLDAYAQRFVVRRQKIVAVELASRGESVGCELVVGNTDPRIFESMMPDHVGPSYLGEGGSPLQPMAWEVVMNVALADKVIPEAMAPELLWINDPNRAPMGGNSLWVSRPGAGPDAGRAQRPKASTLQISARMPAHGPEPSIKDMLALVYENLVALRWLIPWMDEGLRAIDLPALSRPVMSKSHALDMQPHTYELRPQHLRPLYGPGRPEAFGLSALQPETATRNLLLSGDSLYAALGFEGSCFSALQTLQMVREMIRLRVSTLP